MALLLIPTSRVNAHPALTALGYGIDILSGGYTTYYYGDLIRDLAQDSRSMSWGEMITHGVYDYRSPAKVHPWISSGALSLYLGALACEQLLTSKGQKGTLKKQDKTVKSSLFKASMATFISLFWLRQCHTIGAGRLGQHLIKSPIIISSLWLAGRALQSSAAYLARSTIFLHRTKKARPSK